MLKLIVRYVFILAFFITISSCDSPTDVIENQDFDNSYTPMKVGIVKQYFYYSDSSYQNVKISGKAIREDGQEVYIQESNTSAIDNYNIHSSYTFIRDGYHYVTSLVKRGIIENPFSEIRIAKPYPQSGDSWYLTEIPDSEAILFTAYFVGEISTPAGVFQNVYNFQLIDKSVSDTSNVYYAKGIGHIGSLTNSGLVLVNYVKIGDKKYGEQVPIALLPKKINSF